MSVVAQMKHKLTQSTEVKACSCYKEIKGTFQWVKRKSTELPSNCFGSWTKPFFTVTAAFWLQLPGDHADEYQMSLSVSSWPAQWVHSSENRRDASLGESPYQCIRLTQNRIITGRVCVSNELHVTSFCPSAGHNSATLFVWKAPTVCLSMGGQACWGFSHVQEQTAAPGSAPGQEPTQTSGQVFQVCLRTKASLILCWVFERGKQITLSHWTQESRESRSIVCRALRQQLLRVRLIDKCCLLKLLWTANFLIQPLEAFRLDLRVEWSRFMIYSSGRLLVCGSDLASGVEWEAFGRKRHRYFWMSSLYWALGGRGFVCNEAPLCGEKCTWNTAHTHSRVKAALFLMGFFTVYFNRTAHDLICKKL